jgi:hypothetical protein
MPNQLLRWVQENIFFKIKEYTRFLLKLGHRKGQANAKECKQTPTGNLNV